MEALHRLVENALNRFEFVVNRVIIYEWEQKIDEVVIYVSNLPKERTSLLTVDITPAHLRVGLVGNERWFIDEDTFGTVDVAESTWALEDEVLVIYLQKANRGVVWECALKRFAARLDPMQMDQVRQDLMRERWSRENPGMDFSSAVFNGQAPDPRSFMDGCRYT
jgi:CS domain